MAKRTQSSIVKMTKSAFVKEHKTLIRVLESGTKKERKKEAKEQKEELSEYLH